MIGIYKITSPTNRIYIGQSIDTEKRFKDYGRLKCKGQSRLYNSLKKYGVKNHKFEVIEECAVEKLNERERYWQDYYDVISKKGLNCTLVKANGISGKRSYETTFKISMTKYGRPPLEKKPKRENNSGSNNPFYGKKHSEETKRKISLKLKGSVCEKGEKHFNYGRKHKREDVEKRIVRGEKHYFFGKKHKPETIEKIRQKKIGRQALSDNPKAKKVIDTSTGMIFLCLKEVHFFTKINYDILRYRVKKIGYRYQYLEGVR